MSKKMQSQWDFGDLFEQQPARQVFTVSELTGRVRRQLEGQFAGIWVSGEVSNLRTHTSGHSYFTLKDGHAQLNCVLFRGTARESRQHLADGQHVLLQGDLTVYEPRGQYQLRVAEVELQGLGALQLAFDKLKRKLEAEGLFDPTRKRPLPRYCQSIGLVTSPTGAAIRDVIHVVRRRQPGLEIILAPCRVQGEGAAREIADGVALLNVHSRGAGRPLDLILVTRGGGSLEDLWAFNEEVVARAIVASSVPVVSAVGHEIDFTISDFVADLRAATPSAAAEILTQGGFEAARFLQQTLQRFRFLARQQLDLRRQDLHVLQHRLQRVHPQRLVQEKLQYLDDLHVTLNRSALRGFRERQSAARELRRRLVRLNPAQQVGQLRRAHLDLVRRFRELSRRRLEKAQQQLHLLAQRLTLLSPNQVLARGYSITQDAQSGQVLRSADQTRSGQVLRTRLATGEVRSVVEES